jgi:hypothetical protein
MEWINYIREPIKDAMNQQCVYGLQQIKLCQYLSTASSFYGVVDLNTIHTSAQLLDVLAQVTQSLIDRLSPRPFQRIVLFQKLSFIERLFV